LNPLDLELVRSLRARERREETGLYTMEGVRFLIAAADAGAEVTGLVVCKSLLTSVVGKMIVRRLRRGGASVLAVSQSDFASVSKLSDGTGRGVIAVVRQRFRSPRRIGKRELWLAVESIRSPGNLGTLLRTCLAVGARGVFVVGDVEVHDPACVRATMGALPALELVKLTSSGLVQLVKHSRATLVGASPDGCESFRTRRYQGATVLVVGTERSGISDELRRGCHALVRIPMLGRIDSLNVGVAGSLVLYEAFAQRSREP